VRWGDTVSDRHLRAHMSATFSKSRRLGNYNNNIVALTSAENGKFAYAFCWEHVSSAERCERSWVSANVCLHRRHAFTWWLPDNDGPWKWNRIELEYTIRRRILFLFSRVGGTTIGIRGRNRSRNRQAITWCVTAPWLSRASRRVTPALTCALPAILKAAKLWRSD